ncbi:MAG: hypothetical protein AAFY88_26255, partial [Acidobacteriota bacterium]
NSDRAISGRLGLALNQYFELGVSGHRQRFSDDGSDQDQYFGIYGVDLAWRRHGFELRAEWLRAELDRPVPGQPELVQDGAYAQLSYTVDWERQFMPSLTVATRIDLVDPLDGPSDDDFTVLSFGLNAAVYKQFRLKAEYQWYDQRGPELDDDRFLMQAVIDF